MRNADHFANGIELKDMIVYAFVSFASNYMGFIVYIVTTMMFIKGKVTPTYTSLIVFEIIPILAAAALTFLYFKKAVPEQHLDNESRRSWQNNGLWLILPGEIARYLITLLDLGDGDGTGRIALAPSMLFEQTYMKWADIWNRSRLTYGPTDVAAYSLCYLVYAIVYIALILTIYRAVWKHLDAEAARHAAHLREDASHNPEKLSH